MVETVNENGLMVLNRRTVVDETGQITFPNKNGTNIIDIIAGYSPLVKEVSKFAILEWGDSQFN